MATYGHSARNLPYHRFGSGPETLVVIPGVMDSLGWNTPRRTTAELLARYYFRAFREYDVWVLSRHPGLDADVTIGDLARTYASVIERHGSAHVMGLSLGGSIATVLTHEFPDLVDSLVLVSCGTTLGTDGRRILDTWETLAREGEWAALHIEYARRTYSGRHRQVVPRLYRLCRPLLPRPVYPRDVVLSCALLREYHGGDRLRSIETPTLVVGDTDGPLFPLETQRDAASVTPNGYLATFEGGHAVYEESRRTFGDVVTRFLAGQHTD